MIPDFKITKCPEHKVRTKIGTIFANEKILEEYSVQIYEIDPYFYEHYVKKIQFDENGWKYILFRIDVYFTGYFVAVEISGKGHTCRDHTFEEKRQEALDKNLIVNLLQLL